MSRHASAFDQGAKLIAAAAAVLFVAPVAWLALTAFREPGQLFSFAIFFTPTLANFSSVLATYDMARFYDNSLVIAVVVTVGNVVIGGLAAYAFTASGATAMAIGDAMQSGMVGVNSVMISTPETPFGGVKESGYGSEGGIEGLQAYLNTKFISQA